MAEDIETITTLAEFTTADGCYIRLEERKDGHILMTASVASNRQWASIQLDPSAQDGLRRALTAGIVSNLRKLLDAEYIIADERPFVDSHTYSNIVGRYEDAVRAAIFDLEGPDQ